MPTVSDDFNRPDGNPINLAGAWWTIGIAAEGDFKLASNAASPTFGGGDESSIWRARSWGNNQLVFGDLTCTGTAGSGAGIGFLLRCVDSASVKTRYRFVVDHAASNNCEIQRFVGGVFTSVLQFTQAWSDGDRWGFKCVGPPTATILDVYYKGNRIQTATDNSSVASGYPGLGYSSTETAATVDNFEAWDLGTDPQTPLHFVYMRKNV